MSAASDPMYGISLSGGIGGAAQVPESLQLAGDNIVALGTEIARLRFEKAEDENRTAWARVASVEKELDDYRRFAGKMFDASMVLIGRKSAEIDALKAENASLRAQEPTGNHPYHGPTKPDPDKPGRRMPVPDNIHEGFHRAVGDVIAGKVMPEARRQMQEALKGAPKEKAPLPTNPSGDDPRRIGSKLGLLAAVTMFVLLLPGIAQAYTCTNMVASRYVDAKGPPFSLSMDDMINYIAVTYPAVAANPNKLSAVGYLTGVYCGEPGHGQDPLYAVIDDMVAALGDR